MILGGYIGPNPPDGVPVCPADVIRRLELLEAVAEAAHDLYEAVEMDESVGVCLTDRVPSMRLGAALAALSAGGAE